MSEKSSVNDLGATVGTAVGCELGATVGSVVGCELGAVVGSAVFLTRL